MADKCNKKSFWGELKKRAHFWKKTKKYPLLWRALKVYCITKILHRPVVKYIDLAIDYTCNLKCKHCFASRFNIQKKRKMNIEDYRKLRKQCEKLGVLHINFQGGEPLIYKELNEIISAFSWGNKFFLSLTTNGIFATRQRLHELKSLGIDQIVLSIDTIDPQEHDRFRGVKGTFDAAWQALENAQKEGLNVSVNVCLNHKNITTAAGVVGLLERLCSRGIRVNPIFAAAVGRWQDCLDVLLTEEDIAFYNKLHNKFNNLQRDVDASWVQQGCSAIREQIYITPYGDIMPCPFIHVTVGNLFEQDLHTIISKAMNITFFKKYNKKCWVSEERDFIKKYNLYLSRALEIPIHINDCLELFSKQILKSKEKES